VKDAQRHGARFRPVDVARSHWNGVLEEGEVRLGLRTVRGLRAEAGVLIVAARAIRPFVSLQDFVDRTGLRRDEQRMLGEVGALNAFGLTRRSALWQVEKAGRPRGPLLRTTLLRLDEREHRDLLDVAVAARPVLEAAGDVDREAHVLLDDPVADAAAAGPAELLEQLGGVSRHRAQGRS
jgi:hypothetical protein